MKAPSTSRGEKIPTSPSRSVSIQRLLIFHLRLRQLCSPDQKNLSDNATIDEWSEQILYYHIHKQSDEFDFQSSSAGSLHSNEYQTEDAVQFMGLCLALYQLPSTFQGSQKNVDDSEKKATYSHHVCFEQSTLVFVPLEGDSDLLAVVQIPRLYPRAKLDAIESKQTGQGMGGNPLAIRSSIERCHALFSLLRGGSILSRIIQSSFRQSMRELYTLLKTLRKREAELNRIKENDITQQDEIIRQLQSKVKLLREASPMKDIRQELHNHYEDFLAHQTLVQSKNGGAGRCVVEALPPPCSESSNEIQSSNTISLEVLTRSFLDSCSSNQTNDTQGSALLGITACVQDQVLHSHWSMLSMFPMLENFQTFSHKQAMHVSVAKEKIQLLLQYMASYKRKMGVVTSARNGNVDKSNSVSLGFASILSPRALEDGHIKTSADKASVEAMDKGRFMPPPPRFMLNNKAREAEFCRTRDGYNAWVLPVHLPFQIINERQEHGETFHVKMRVVLFEIMNYSFLLFASSGMIDLTKIQEELVQIVKLDHKSRVHSMHLQFQEKFQRGQDIIAFDRETNRLYLSSNRRHPSRRNPRGKSVPNKHGSSMRQLFGLRKSHSVEDSVRTKKQNKQALDWTTLGLDCRHFLASNLHLDTLLALDDVMNEVVIRRRRRQNLQEDDFSTSFSSERGMSNTISVELCTCLPSLGWVYACATEKMELYAFFDSNIYVTVADVQNAASILQDHFLR